MVSLFESNSSHQLSNTESVHMLHDVWRVACDGLSSSAFIDDRGAVDVRGTQPGMFSHDVSITLVADRNRNVRTQYDVALDAQIAPEFTLRKRVGARQQSSFTAGDALFDAAAIVETENHHALRTYLTPERRLAICKLLAQVPDARITKQKASVRSKGVDQNPATVAQVMQPLLDAAESMSPSWVDIPLDEQSVLADLFDTGNNPTLVEKRFQDLYLGNSVRWTGEVLEVGGVDATGRRIAMFVGNASSGRVIAYASVKPTSTLAAGDVMTIEGALWKLDARKRSFFLS